MGYKILDVKADIHEDVEKYFVAMDEAQGPNGFQLSEKGRGVQPSGFRQRPHTSGNNRAWARDQTCDHGTSDNASWY